MTNKTINFGISGFTLLEILVALAIAAIGITAVSGATQGHVGAMQFAEDRVLSNWVASNYLAELRINRQWRGSGERQEAATLGGRTWYIKEKVSNTEDPEIVRLDLNIYTDQKFEHQSGVLFGYLARPHE